MENVKSNKNNKVRFIAVIIVLVALGLVVYFFMHLNQETTDDAQIESTVNSISPKVSGYITGLPVSDNQYVKAGDLIVQIDPTDYQIKVDHAKANLDAANAKLAGSSSSLETTKVSAPSNVDAATADVAQASATWDNANKLLKRIKSLSDEARSQQQLDAAIAQERAARASLDAAKAKLRDAETAPHAVATAQANADELHAEVKQAEADLAQAQSDLDNTKIIAPITGRVTNKGVQQGDYVQPGQQLFSLVGEDIYVVANFKETQLRDMIAGDRVRIDVDAFPNLKLEGKVDSIQYGTGARFSAFPPENATGNFVKIVQRVPVKIVFTNLSKTQLPIGPGISVVPIVYTK